MESYKKSDHNSFYCDTHDLRSGKDKKLQLHRYILNYNGKKLIDHINRNGLDNRKFNLRKTTVEINGKNSSKQKNNNNLDLPMGVYYDNSNNIFRVFWSENKKSKGKRFSINKLGYKKALNKAIRFRYKKCRENGYNLKDIEKFIKDKNVKIKRIE